WLMMSLWDALRMNMMISYQELVRTFPNALSLISDKHDFLKILQHNALPH
ncbi:hypothetical protein ACTZSK_18830, partial [Klebsiella pneumoniae]